MRISIFDYDLTCTNEHTFHSAKLNEIIPGHSEAEYLKGKARFEALKKTNLETSLIHDSDHSTSIATYHNNPSFIAGFFSSYFNRELVYKETIPDPNSPSAVAKYYVEGINHPFLISYIPAVGKDFQNTLTILKNKNFQINHLLTLIKFEGISDSENINFYDDSEDNVKGASSIEGIKSHLVTNSDPSIFFFQQHTPDQPKNPIQNNSQVGKELSELREKIIRNEWEIGSFFNFFSTGVGGRKYIVDEKEIKLPHHIASILNVIDAAIEKNDTQAIEKAKNDIVNLALEALSKKNFGRSANTRKFYEQIINDLIPTQGKSKHATPTSSCA